MKLTKLLAIVACAAFPLLAGAQTKYTRGILIEYFTSQYCSNCPPTSDALKELCADEGENDRVVWLTHHYGYANDTLTIEASKAPNELCGLSGAPQVMLNRTFMRLGSGLEKLVLNVPVSMVNYNDYLKRTTGSTLFQREMAAGADISLDMDLTYDEATRELTVKVYGEKNELFDASNPALTVYLVETSWVGWQAENFPGIYNYHHMNPVRLPVSDNDLGDALEFADDGTYSKTYQLTIPESVGNYPTYDVDVPLNRDSLYVAAFISNIDMNDKENLKVYNAVKCDLGNNSTVGISEVTSTDDLAIVVEDGTIKVNGSDKGFDIYNLAGQVTPNRSLGRGIYLVRAMLGGVPVVRKVLVN